MYDLAEAANETYDEDAGLDPTLLGDDDFAGGSSLFLVALYLILFPR